jgi:hypothetical protein
MIFSNNKTTLKETSKDTHDGKVMFMTESTHSVVDFDAVKHEYIKGLRLSEVPASNDALCIGNNEEYYFIEFKNGLIDKEKKFKIRLKLFDSLLMFTDIVGSGVSFTRSKMSYILVYNKKKNPLLDGMQDSPSRDYLGHKITGKAKKTLKQLDLELDRFEGLYLKTVYTYTEEAFESEFVLKLSS